MSREIDERIVQMKFESGQFEKNVQTSIHSLEELKKGLDFKDATKGLEGIDKASKGLKFDGLSAGIEALNNRFTLLGITGLNVMNRIANAAINAGERMVKSLSTDQITQGFSKYADKTSAVQTIMSATAKQFTDTGEQMEYVNSQLEKLNWFTDETSYNFLDMVSNIGKFTSNNIPLDQSVTSMQGIATWAAQAGANAGEASRAMYNLSQAISVGSVKLIDWKSIENANMATASFKETVLETAASMGTLIKQGDKFVTAGKKTEVSVSNFNEALSEGWFNSQVLLNVLDKYGGAANRLNQIVEETGVITSELIGYIDDYSAGTLDLEKAAASLGLSMDETKAIMEEFQDETMQFGLKAFKSAQEAKTFEEAINSVKDAVSSGWMQTFEYIFGDYEKAKELWTDVANILYTLFAESGNARNALLDTWSQLGGREMLLASMYNMLTAILRILTPIKKAWQSVFPPATAKTLLDLTERLYNFTESLQISEKTAYTLQTAFRGLFTLLDTVKFIITSGLKSAFSVLQKVMAELNIDLSKFVAHFTMGTIKLNNYVKTQTWATDIIEKFGDVLVGAIRKVKELIEAIKGFGPVQSFLNAFRAVFTSDFNGIASIITFVGNTISSFFSLIASMPFPQSLTDIKQFFSDFSVAVSENLDTAGIDFSAFEKLLGSGWVTLTKLAEAFVGAAGMAGTSVSKAIDMIKDQLKEVDWSGVALLATGVAIVAMIYKISDAVTSVANSLLAFTNIGKTIQGVFKGVTKVLESTANVIDATKWAIYGATMIEVAVAFGILAGSLIALSKVPIDDLQTVSFYLGILAIGLTTFVYALGQAGSAPKISGVLLSFAIAIGTFTAAMNALDVSDPSAVVEKIGVITAMLFALVGAAYLMGKYVKPIQVGTTSLIGIVASLYLMMSLMKSIGKEDPKQLMASMTVVSVMMLVLAGISRLLTQVTVLEKDQKRVKSGGVLKLIGLMASLLLLIAVLKKIGNTDPALLLKGILGLVPVIAAMGTLFIASKKVGQYAAQAGPMLVGAAAALYILVGVIRKLGDIPVADIIKGGLVIVAIEKFAFAPLIEAAKYSGKNAAKVGLMLLSMAGALAIIQLVVKTLGKLDAATLIKGTAAVSVLVYSFVPMIKALSTKGNIETTKQLTRLIVAIGLLGTIVFLLSKFTDMKSTLAAAAGMSAVILSLGETMNLMRGMKQETLNNRVKVLFKLSIVAAAMAVVIGALALATKGTDPKVALANATSIGLILVALAASINLIPTRTAAQVKNIQGMMAPMMGFIVTAGLVVAALALVSKDANPATTVALATALGEIMLALCLAMAVVPKYTSAQVKNVDAMMKPMLTFLVAAGAVVAALAFFGKDTDSTTVIALATSLGAVMVALGASMKLINGVKVPGVTEIVKMGAFVAAIGSVIAILSGIGDPLKMTTLAAGISALLMSLSASMRIMNSIKIDGTTIGAAYAMVGAATVIGILLGALSYMVNPDTVLPIATGISLVLLAMSGAVAIIGLIPTPSISSAISAAGAMIALVGVMTMLLLALGTLVDSASAGEVLRNGGEVLKQIGIAIGGFVGGIIGGVVGGAIEGVTSSFPAVCKALSEGTAELIPMFENLKAMPGGIIEMIGTLTGMVAAVTAAEFVAGLEAIPGIGLLIKSGKENLSENFAALGEALNAFAASIGDLNAYKVKAAAEAVAALGSVQGDLKEGGLMGLLFGTSSDAFSQFVTNVPLLGEGLKKFAEETEGINEGSVKGAVSAADMLVALEKSVAPSGGILNSWLFGEQDLSEFGQRITSFARELVAFGSIVSGQNGSYGINQEAVDAASRAGTMLSDLEKNLPPNGGLIQDLFLGNRDLAGFGLRLKQFGSGLVSLGEECATLDTVGVSRAIWAARQLIDLESGITTGDSGLWGDLFGSEGNFSSFGNNLIDLGEGIRMLGSKASVTNFEGIQQILDVITTLGDVGTIDDSIKSIVSKVSGMISSLQKTITDAYQPTLVKAKELAKHMIDGIVIGITINTKNATDAVGRMASAIVTRFEKDMQIHSPSVVMKQEGIYIVQGVAEGIEGSTSAEEAASKKAQNIISAFQEIFDNADLKIQFGNIRLEHWKLTEGRGANWEAQLQKDIEAKRLELQQIGEKVKASYAKFLAIQQSGASEQEIKEAEIAYFEMSNSYLSLRNEIIDAQIDSAESMIEELDLLDEVRQAEYDRWLSSKEGKGSSAVEKTAKEMQLLVSQLESIADTTAILWARHKETVKEFGEDSTEARNAYIKALNSEQKLNETYDSIMEKQKGSFDTLKEARDNAIKEYSNFMYETAPKLLEMGFTEEQIKEQAKRFSKWGSVWEGDFGGGITTEQLDAAMERAHADVSLVKDDLVDVVGSQAVDGITVQLTDGIPTAISKAGKSASSAARQTGTDLGNEAGEGFNESFNKKAVDAVDNATNGYASKAMDALQKSSAAAEEWTGKFSNGIIDELAYGFGTQSPSWKTEEMGKNVIEGLIIGLEDDNTKRRVAKAAEELAKIVLDTIKATLDKLSATLESDSDFSPTITPVLDMDTLKNQSKQIPSVLSANSGINVSSSVSRARSVSSSLKQNGSVGGDGAPSKAVGNTYNFTQNNYSPKALSQYDLYRQTKNQFSQLKGATSK